MKSGFIEPIPRGPRKIFVGPPLLVEEVAGSNGMWRLARELIYKTTQGIMIHVPEGFLTNFASVPHFFWSIYPPWDRHYGRASVVHDYVYTRHGHIAPDINFTRREVDLIFRDAMKDLGAGYFTRSTIFNAVRLFNKEWPDESHESHIARNHFRHVSL